MKLTAKAVERIRTDKDREDIKDDVTPGLYLRVHRSGHKAWRYRYRMGARTKWHVIGAAVGTGALSLAEARARAREMAEAVRAGSDPGALEQKQRAERRAMPAVTEFAEEYIERYAKPSKKTWREDKRILDREVIPRIGKLKMSDVHRRDVLTVIDAIRDRGAPVQSNRALGVVRRMFGFAVERGVIDETPVRNIKAVRETARDRVLSDDELRTLWEATAAGSKVMHPQTALGLRLLLLTGARAGEVAGIATDELELEASSGPRWILPASRSKNGQAHVVPLVAEAVAIVEGAREITTDRRMLFGTTRGTLTVWAFDQAMARLFDGAHDRPTPHDIRRTVGTRLGELGWNRLIVDKVLNHKDRSVGGIYDRHSYDREKRAALTAWEAELLRIVEGRGPSGNVVAMEAAR